MIGFDDTPVAQALGLSSIRQPLADVAAACIETVSMLLNDARGSTHRRRPPGNPRQSCGCLLTPDLIVRDSG